MGTVVGFPPLPEPVEVGEHDVVGASRWGDTLRCACGLIAIADHELQAWVGDLGHVIAFGETPARFFEPERDADEADVEPIARRRPGRIAIEAQVRDSLGLVPASVPEEAEEPTHGD